MRETIALCQECGRPYAAEFDEEGTLRVKAGSECPKCGGTEFRPMAANE